MCARLYTLIENCRLAGVDSEAYLIDLVTRLPSTKMAEVAAWLPRAWKAAAPGPSDERAAA